MCLGSTPQTPTTSTVTTGRTGLSRRVRWKNIVSAVALGVAVRMQVFDPEHFSWEHLIIWLGVAISGHLVSKIPGRGGEK